VVDVKAIPDLQRVELTDDGLRLGAAVCCWDLTAHADVRQRYPGLVESAELIGSMQIQGRATVGGNVCNGSPAADTTPALMALGAECVIAGPDGTRSVPVEVFVTGPGETALAAGELLVEFKVPAPPARSADAYLRFTPRGEMDIAVVGAGVRVELDEAGTCIGARVALGAVAATPILVPEAADAVIGSRLETEAIEEAARLAAAAADPIDDKRGTAVFRKRIAAVLTRRSLTIAAERARSRS
jgi:carbon-monoxide dehydrogenase medium subunit